MSRVLRELERQTGVTLTAAGGPGDERLVAFVPDEPLSEVLDRVAELYRCDWVVIKGGKSPSYELVKSLRAAREESELRRRALGQLLQKLLASIRTQAAPEAGTDWSSTLPVALPLLFARSDDLLRDGAVYLPVAALPKEQRETLESRMQPELNAQHLVLQEFLKQARARMAEQGQDFHNLTFSGEDRPPPAAQGCTLIAEISAESTLLGSVSLKTGMGVRYPWSTAFGDSLQDAAFALYAERHPRLPSSLTQVATPGDGADPFERAVEIPPAPMLKKGDWIGRLGQFSAAAHVPVYADCYTDYHKGIDIHPRSKFSLSGRTTPSQALNRVCFPVEYSGATRLSPGGFWWRAGNSALIRSRIWLWEEAAVLPAGLGERLTASLRRQHNLGPEDLAALAALNGLQVRGVGFLEGHQDTWQRAVVLPARLSAAARQAVVRGGVEWSALSGADRVMLARLLPPELWAGYRASLQTSVSDLPDTGGAVASIDFRTNGAEEDDESIVHIPLAGVTADEKLEPRGLEVMLLAEPPPSK